VMPPRVCCANKALKHSATAATNASSLGIRGDTVLLVNLTMHGLENRDFPSGLDGGRRDALESVKLLVL
jgi:hypothetical protein